MINLGIFAKTFPRSSFGETLDAVVKHGLKIIHFNYSCVGLPPMPDQISPEIVKDIRKQAEDRGIKIAGVSGTFNIIDPDVSKRKEGLERLRVIAKTCKGINTRLITLCSGTRDPKDMWKEHPENNSAEAWNEMIEMIKECIKIAEEEDVLLGIEPEVANVVDSARKARRLLDEMGSQNLKIIMDPANIFRAEDVPSMTEFIDEAFSLLENDIVMAHAKDFKVENEQIIHVAPGKGLINYDLYLQHLQNLDVPLIMHGFKEEEVDSAMKYILSKMNVRK